MFDAKVIADVLPLLPSCSSAIFENARLEIGMEVLALKLVLRGKYLKLPVVDMVREADRPASAASE
jgi:hypothetical protein